MDSYFLSSEFPSLFEEGSESQDVSLEIQESIDYIYNLIKTSLLPERYREDVDFDIYVKLLSSVLGEVLYYQNELSNLTDPDNCDAKFLYLLAGNYGYSSNSSISTENLRLLIKYYQSLRRRRGTMESIKNAVRFSGEDEFSLLISDGGLDIKVNELKGTGLFYIESSNIDIDSIVANIEHVRPAGIKWSYALSYNVPIIRSTEEGFSKFSIGIYIGTLREDTLLPSLYSELSIVNKFSSNDLIGINLSEDSSLYSDSISLKLDILSLGVEDSSINYVRVSSQDTLETSIIESSSFGNKPYYGESRYGNSRFGEGEE